MILKSKDMSNFKFTAQDRTEIHKARFSGSSSNYIIDRIESIVNERDGWISVEDAMPPPSNRIIVCKANGLVCEMYCNHNGSILYDGLKQTSQITHWQPLPNPPKSKQ